MGTILVGILLGAAVAAAIVCLVKKKKRGEALCCGGCEGCSMECNKRKDRVE